MDLDQIQAEDDMLITVDVARAVEERELLAYYQPVVSLATRDAVAAEALVRWTMPDGTIVSAALFVPSLERTNTICGLDWFMAEEATAPLSEEYGTTLSIPISLNFSVRHADDPDFADKLASIASWRKTEPEFMRVEFSAPTLLAADDQLLALVKSTCEKGFPLVADNFAGTEKDIDSLAALGVTQLKIATTCWKSERVASIVAAAKDKGLTVSAEGVEHEDEVAALQAAGIEAAQGYLFAKPMDLKSLEAFCA